MNTFKKKSLHAAVLAGLGALGAAGTANAVHINPDGLGQVILYPYYTVRSGNATAMSIVNTTSLTKAVKVRYLEGKNSREVLDFNLFLSPQDVWTGVIVTGISPPGALPSGVAGVVNTDGARLESGDNSCVTPNDLFGSLASTTGLPVRLDPNLPINAFKNYQYTGINTDNATFNTLDRTREGYMEIFEMGIVTTPLVTGFIKHGAANGVPANCAALDAYDQLSTQPVPPGGRFPFHLINPGGGLTGRASIINAPNGTNYTTDVTAVDAWWGNVAGVAPPYSEAGNTQPRFAGTTGVSLTSDVFVTGTPGVANSAGVVNATWFTETDSVASILMRDTIINEFITDAGTSSRTDWVITMPTKHASVSPGSGSAPTRPFTNNFANATPTGACDAYGLGIFNREEGVPGVTPTDPVFLLPSPRPGVIPPPAGVAQVLCWEANVLEFGTVGLLGSTNRHRLLGLNEGFASTGAVSTGSTLATLSRRTPQGPNGWAFLSFGSTGVPTQASQSIRPIRSSINGIADLVPRTYFGLPVIGTAFHNYTNAAVTSSYGGEIPHKYTRLIR